MNEEKVRNVSNNNQLVTLNKRCAGIIATRQKCDRRIFDSITFAVAFLHRLINATV